jgi:hypothetical protein
MISITDNIWPSYNWSLIRRSGEILFAYDFLDINSYGQICRRLSTLDRDSSR